MLGIIRLLCGWMLFYNLAVWTLDLEAFFGDNGLQPLEAIRAVHESRFVFSFWLWTGDAYLWPIHFLCLAISAMFCLGFATRITSVLSFLITISYSQRVPIANFGFDQILGMLCLYLSLGPSGAAVSVDWLIRKRRLQRQGRNVVAQKYPSARMAMRLIQLHLCAIYFWAGFAKLKGPTWWTGEAMWRVLANQEYQTWDLTWMAWVPWLPFLIAHVTIAWEVFFIVLIWNPKLRPLMLTMGVAMHVGIGAFLGMWTFGLIMAFAYLAFSNPDVWRYRLSLFGDWVRRKRQKPDLNAQLDEYFISASTVEIAGGPPGSVLTATDVGVQTKTPLLAAESVEAGAVVQPASLAQDAAPDTADDISRMDSAATALEQICIVAASPADRSTLRRYFRDHEISCRAVSDLSGGLDVVSRYRVTSVILNCTQFSSSAVVDFVSDVSDLTNLPVLVLLTPGHLSVVDELEKISHTGWLELPASLREIRVKMGSMAAADPSSDSSKHGSA